MPDIIRLLHDVSYNMLFNYSKIYAHENCFSHHLIPIQNSNPINFDFTALLMLQ